MKKTALIFLITLTFLALPVRAQINLLHEFAGDDVDGRWPNGSLILSGSTLYGMTNQGGASGYGILFKVKIDGLGYTILHEFAGGIDDGAYPGGSLVISGSTLYGMTSSGGDNNLGTIFKIVADGSGYALLHEFAGGDYDGGNPVGSLIVSDSVLFGMTYLGGDNDNGTIFKMQTNGDNFSLLHEFSESADDGNWPSDSLILSNSTLYGMTYWGGSYNNGTIFKIETDGSGFLLLHEFAGGPDDGNYPHGSLILSETTLYGMTFGGGDDGLGTIFKLENNGTGFILLHEFADNDLDGHWPYGSLIIFGSTLYGMTSEGGGSDYGTIFGIETNGTGFSLLHEFSGGANDGNSPAGNLVLSGLKLFGMTRYGGDVEGGVIFSLPLPSITVTSPNGGESWPLGSSQKITWDFNSLSGNVRLVLYRNDVKVGVIATVPATQGCFNWMAGAYSGGTAVAAKNYRIKAVTADGMYSDWSDASFTLSLDPYVRVATPNGGESWVKGGIQAINWDCRGVSGNVRLVLYSGNTKVGVIATVAASRKNYNWTVGNYSGGSAAAGSNYRIKVVTIDGMHADYSDKPFSIRTI